MDKTYEDGLKDGYLKGLLKAVEIADKVMGYIPDASNGRYNACTEIKSELETLIKEGL